MKQTRVPPRHVLCAHHALESASNKPATWNEGRTRSRAIRAKRSSTQRYGTPPGDHPVYLLLTLCTVYASVYRGRAAIVGMPAHPVRPRRHRPLFWNGGQNGLTRGSEVVYLVPATSFSFVVCVLEANSICTFCSSSSFVH